MTFSRPFKNTVNFCFAYLLSAFGFEFIFFVMTLYVYNLSKSAWSVGVFTALTFLPRLFASFLGAAADYYRREIVLGVSLCLTGTLIMVMSQLSFSWMYLVWFFISVFLTQITTVRTALMTEIMSTDNYLWGNSAVLVSLNLAKIIAPLVGGIISTVYSWEWLMYFTGLVYLAAAVFARAISLPPRINGQRKSILSQVRKGLEFISQEVNLKYLLSVVIFWRLFLGLQISLLVVYVKSYLGGSDAQYGFFMTAIGVGSILGSMLGPWIAKKVRHARLIRWGLSAHYLSFVVLGLLVDDYLAALPLAFVSYGLFYATLVGLHSLRDRVTPLEIRGRVYGSVTAMLTPPAIISMLAGGYLASQFGPEKIIATSGLLALVSLQIMGVLLKRNAASEEVAVRA